MRCTLLLPFVLLPLLPAQEPAVPPEPVVPPEQAELVDRPLTPEEREKQLQQQRDKLRAELDALRAIEAKGGLPALLRRRLAERELTVATIQGQAAPAAVTSPQSTETRGARLLGDAEKAGLGPDVVFTVAGLPVTQQELDSAIEFLRSAPHSENEDELKTRAMLELIRLRAAQAEFAETAKDARKRIEAAAQELSGGADFAAVAQKHSDCPSKSNGGDLDFFTRDLMDFWFSRAAFGMKVGEVSGIVPTTFGYHLIKVTGRDQASGGERVRASHVLALYAPDQARVREVQMKVSNGKLDLAFAKDDLRKLAPAQFR